MKLSFMIVCCLLCFGADKPTLTTEQKLEIRNLQVQKQALELQMADLIQRFQALQKQADKIGVDIAGKIKDATPQGYELDAASLTLKEKMKSAETPRIVP